MNIFLKFKITKIILINLLPMGIGLLLPIVFNDFQNKNSNIGVISLLLICIAIYIISLLKYQGYEKDATKLWNEMNIKMETKETELQKALEISRSLKKETQALSALCIDSSTSINDLSKKILDGKAVLDIWNFTKVATGLCSSIYDVLCAVCSDNDELEINILLDDVTASKNKRNYTMIAYKGKFAQYPSKFQKQMYYKDNKTFHATSLFSKNNSDICILTTKEEVNEKFVYNDSDHKKYNQYIGIPIVCSGNNMISLLQICSFGNYKIADTKEEVLEIVKTYILPFTQFGLLNYKVEKAFLSSFKMLDKQEGEISGKETNKK